MKNLYKNLSELRDKHRLRMEDVADHIGKSRKTYFNYEHGAPIPSDILFLIAELYKIKVEQLFQEDPGPTNQVNESMTEYRVSGLIDFSKLEDKLNGYESRIKKLEKYANIK